MRGIICFDYSDEENIAIMHSFVDQNDFQGISFVPALRGFLQSFRLPGESQKIDRFMLKFADKFLCDNPNAFSSADTAYVLAYSVIMLNTDQHNAQVKKRMTKPEFLKNNRGIDDGKNLDDSILEDIFDEIFTNEIIMKDEIPKPVVAPAQTILGSIVVQPELIFGKPKESTGDLTAASENMALKTEALFSNLAKPNKATGKSEQLFFNATRYEHVKPMFEIIWLAILAGMSSCLHESEQSDTINLALNGLKYSIHIASIFDMQLELKAFLATLMKYALLNDMTLVKPKNLEAVKILLEVALHEGEALQEGWVDVISCIVQLDKLQASLDSKVLLITKNFIAKSSEGNALEISSQTLIMSIDRIFASSVRLSGSAIIHLVRALSNSSWEEISSSVDKEHPRMYCLQRLVEISYYNMKRIRVEWSGMWAILGDHFKQVGCYPNTNVAFFAIDKLRQLSMKFLEIDEFANFKFQQEFLKPFEDIMRNNSNPKIKDMCLTCLQQIIQAKGRSIKSGWKTILGTLIKAAREVHESLLAISFEMLKEIYKNNFEAILLSGSFGDYITCLSELCKNKKSLKISTAAIEYFPLAAAKVRGYILDSLASNSPRKNSAEGNSLANSALPNLRARSASVLSPEEDVVVKYWMPFLFNLHGIIMESELDIRTK